MTKDTLLATGGRALPSDRAVAPTASSPQAVSPVPASIPSAEVLPDSFSIMRTTRWDGEFKPNLNLCRVGISYKVGRGYDRRQCQKAAKVTRMIDGPNGPEPIGFCNTHDPLKVKKRDQDRAERWKESARLRTEQCALEAHVRRTQPAYCAALQKIAAGADDARAIAVAVLEKYDDLPASAIEARSGETAQQARSGTDESAVPSGRRPETVSKDHL